MNQAASLDADELEHDRHHDDAVHAKITNTSAPAVKASERRFN